MVQNLFDLALTHTTGRNQFHVDIHTLRMPFQRLYVVHTPSLIQAIQSKANAATFIPNLLDFGMLFSGMNKESQGILAKTFGVNGNAFTMSVHKYLLAGPSLKVATSTAVDRLSASLPNNFAKNNGNGLLELVRHELTLALTGAIYGPENPYDNPAIESSWWYAHFTSPIVVYLANTVRANSCQASIIYSIARSHT
jgi:hypothetical protein